jgi:hypothetical protein
MLAPDSTEYVNIPLARSVRPLYLSSMKLCLGTIYVVQRTYAFNSRSVMLHVTMY